KRSSGTEDRPDADARALRPLGRTELLGLLALHLGDLDLAALAGDAHRRVGDLGDLADLALHVAELAHQVLLRAEELDLLAVERGPRARRGIGGADQVVHARDVVV